LGRTGRQDHAGQYAVFLNSQEERVEDTEQLDDETFIDAMLRLGDEETAEKLDSIADETSRGKLMHKLTSKYWTLHARGQLDKKSKKKDWEWKKLCEEYAESAEEYITERFNELFPQGRLIEQMDDRPILDNHEEERPRNFHQTPQSRPGMLLRSGSSAGETPSSPSSSSCFSPPLRATSSLPGVDGRTRIGQRPHTGDGAMPCPANFAPKLMEITSPTHAGTAEGALYKNPQAHADSPFGTPDMSSVAAKKRSGAALYKNPQAQADSPFGTPHMSVQGSPHKSIQGSPLAAFGSFLSFGRVNGGESGTSTPKARDFPIHAM
jgi:hypothetical protein